MNDFNELILRGTLVKDWVKVIYNELKKVPGSSEHSDEAPY